MIPYGSGRRIDIRPGIQLNASLYRWRFRGEEVLLTITFHNGDEGLILSSKQKARIIINVDTYLDQLNSSISGTYAY